MWGAASCEGGVVFFVFRRGYWLGRRWELQEKYRKKEDDRFTKIQLDPMSPIEEKVQMMH